MSTTEPVTAASTAESEQNGTATTAVPSSAKSNAPVHPIPASKAPKGILVKSSSSVSIDSTSPPTSSASSTSSSPSLPSLSLSTDVDSTPISSPVSNSHPLHRAWTFHFSLPSEKKSWDESSITQVCSVQTVEHFWAVFQALAKPTSLPARADVHFFLTNVQPTWEEPANAMGGRWLIEYKRGEEEALNAAYTLTLLALIGEQWTDGEEMMGCVLSLRKGKNKLHIWTRTGAKREEQMRIGREWKDIVDYRGGKIGYMTHEDSKKYSQEMKTKYEV